MSKYASQSENLRGAFDQAYDGVILGNAFFEGDAYYHQYRDRYWNTLRYIADAQPAPGGRVLDIGSGQFALLCRELFDMQPAVADLETPFRKTLEDLGVAFYPANLAEGGVETDDRFDLIVFAEVIEHLPRPPVAVLRDLANLLKPGGKLVLTTPNVFRLRNVIRMVVGRQVFDPFDELKPGSTGLGHFVEYALAHLSEFTERAGLTIEKAELTQLSQGGASRGARLARRATAGLVKAVPRLRENIVIVASKP